MTNNTDQGEILFTFTMGDVLGHLKARAEHHTKRNEQLVKEAKDLEAKGQAAVDEADTVSDRMMTKGSSGYANDARARDMKLESARNHARHAAKFFFLADHFKPGATAPDASYVQLSLSELQRLEFIFD